METDSQAVAQPPGSNGGGALRTRRLREATKYVARAWLPPSPVVFKRLNDKLASPTTVDSEDIQSEIRSDFGLFAHCMRKLGGSFDEKGSMDNPAQLMRALTVDQLRSMFSVHQSEISTHDLSNARDVQLARMKHSVISCSTVEVLAGCANIDRDLAFVCAMIRQLGHLLVAWNYPSSCVRAKSGMDATGIPFDDELEKLVGFDPSRLGFEAAAAWCKNPQFLFGLGKCINGFMDQITPEETSNNPGAMLLQFCQVGEVLARINDPENYPTATQHWKATEDLLKRYLGSKGTVLIRDKIEELYPHYVTLAPNLFPRDLSPERAMRTVNVLYSRKLLESNVYVKRCPDDIKSLFGEVYDQVVQNEPSYEAVNSLVTKVIPTAGFMSGCIYLLDPVRMLLTPRLFIGEKRGNFKPVPCSCGGDKSHPVSEAFQCSMPLKQENTILNGEVVSYVTGRFGTGDKTGVLYLEFRELLASTLSSENRLMYFKAIRQALNDCLNLHS